MVLVQKWSFFQLFFQAMQIRKMSFTIFQKEKTPFQTKKTTSSNSRKIDIFPKGLTHGFGPKMAIFPTCFFYATQGRKMSFRIFQKEKTPFQAIKRKGSNSGKIDIFPKGLTNGFGPKMAIFPTFFFRQQWPRKSLLRYSRKKNAFLCYKNKKLKNSKNWHFSKGVNPWFCCKNGHFFNFYFLGNKGQENVFYDFLERKNAFLEYENKKFKNSKN